MRFLKALVTVLTAVMIIGMVVVVGLLITRLNGAQSLVLPDTLTLPEGARATAITTGPDWYAVVTDTNQILIYNADHSLRQTVEVQTP